MKSIVLSALVSFICLLPQNPAESADGLKPKTGLELPAPPYIAPTIVSPTSGQSFYAQNPVPIRITTPPGMNVTDYLVTIQKKEPDGTWSLYTKDPIAVPAAQAQSANGYTGFAPPAGTWRVNALAFRPTESRWSPPVEFTVITPPKFRLQTEPVTRGIPKP